MVLKIIQHARSNPYTWLTGLLLCISSYLCLVNLDYSLLYDDEAHVARVGKIFLETGTFTFWGERNLDSFGSGDVNLNSKGESIWPPVMYVFSALGIAIFGYNEIGARSVHAFIGILALIMFLMLLRQQLPDNHRLQFLGFLFATLSVQLLLYLRQAHYSSFAVFSFLSCVYFYELYWRSKHTLWAVALTTMGLLAFLNHYSIGSATILTIATYHALLRTAVTSKKQWLVFGGAVLLIALVGITYLSAVEALSSIAEVRADYAGERNIYWHWYHHLLKLWIGIKTIIAADWLCWWICIWFFMYWIFCRSKLMDRINFSGLRKLILLGMLFFVFSVLLSMQRHHDDSFINFINLQYLPPALPLLLTMKAMFIDWLLSRRKLLGAVLMIALLSSSIGAIPFEVRNHYTGESMHGLHLISFIKEIHRPYRPDPIDEVAKYLRKNAKKDDLLFLHPIPQIDFRRNILFYIGDHVLLCCLINRDHPIPSVRTSVRQSLFLDPRIIPDWIVILMHRKYSVIPQRLYSQNWTSHRIPLLAHQTQSPELNLHAFKPHTKPRFGGIIILKRKDNPANPDTWF
ncbi:MAG: hypothetical protein OYH77_06420 [Pseudomonadota bacterium]|nr:hypothetical protein [Pseudomonadota bacterium]